MKYYYYSGNTKVLTSYVELCELFSSGRISEDTVIEDENGNRIPAVFFDLNRFYYYKGNEKIGPLSIDEMNNLASCGKITPETRVEYMNGSHCPTVIFDFDNLPLPRNTMRTIVLATDLFYIPFLTFVAVFLFGRSSNMVGVCASCVAGVVLWILTVRYADRHKIL